MKETELIESRQLRDQMVGRYEVLETVKELLLIPGTEVMSAQKVADYYEIGKEAIEAIYTRHFGELYSDGVYVRKYNEVSNLHYESLKTAKGKVVLTFENGETLDYPTRGLKVFPRRAILRIGMLLRDSGVAKEVRNQLLNIEEKTSDEVKTTDLNEEMKLALSLGMAQASGNVETYQKAVTDMMAFKNRHIQKLETDNGKLIADNKALAEGNLEWSDRSQINYSIRRLAGQSGISIQKLWNDLYQQLLYKYHINVKTRGKQPWIKYVEENEWNCVNKVFSTMCNTYGQSASEILESVKIK